ncbi:FAD-dependent oxidoreductase [Arthrobacter oryzae]|uniref:NAD(P)/FAD-dependent oxidoreductase n=1 Tax=Arthrobacter oryzae TaxID=409290 RepID=UPI002862514B|nr:FAD-dependent oxidoreductase [Arthrobacter oryzae]MDR6507624.1 glycine/D-amino acid oxidase-like deaminating enzyme [Arthrobacter oryzae]
MNAKFKNVEYATFTGWIDPPTELAPSLRGIQECDVAVVGGGVGGMATALRLAQRGVDVVLLEPEFCGYGASSRNGGQIASAPGGDLRMLRVLSPKKLPGMVRFADNAAHYVDGLIEDHKIDCDYDANGMVWAAVSPIQMFRVKTLAAILRKVGVDGQVGTAKEIGIPEAFVGGMRERRGGMLNRGKLSRGVRRALLDSSARVFEKSRVIDVQRRGGKVVMTTSSGAELIANRVVLSTNAYSGEWDIIPKHLSTPSWIIEVETEPIAPERIAALGWTSRSGVVTQHQIMENFRLTARNTIVFGVRRLESGANYPLQPRSPDPGMMRELADNFYKRFPSLSDVPIARCWGGWISFSSSWTTVAGRVGDNVYYSASCNGHGLAQAPYLGSLIADNIVDGKRSADLESVWEEKAGYAPSPAINPLVLRAVWLFDRVSDLFNGSRRRARLAAH